MKRVLMRCRTAQVGKIAVERGAASQIVRGKTQEVEQRCREHAEESAFLHLLQRLLLRLAVWPRRTPHVLQSILSCTFSLHIYNTQD